MLITLFAKLVLNEGNLFFKAFLKKKLITTLNFHNLFCINYARWRHPIHIKRCFIYRNKITNSNFFGHSWKHLFSRLTGVYKLNKPFNILAKYNVNLQLETIVPDNHMRWSMAWYWWPLLHSLFHDYTGATPTAPRGPLWGQMSTNVSQHCPKLPNVAQHFASFIFYASFVSLFIPVSENITVKKRCRYYIAKQYF